MKFSTKFFMFYAFLFMSFLVGLNRSSLGMEDDFQTVGFNYQPARVKKEKDKYTLNFINLDKPNVNENEKEKFLEVKMGEIKWLSEEDLNINIVGLFTQNIQDCVSVVFKGATRMGLGHISLFEKDYELLEKEVIQLGKEDYEIYLVSHYFSKNLENVVNIILKNGMIIKGADISNNFALCNENYSFFGPLAFFYSEEKNMQAQNSDSRNIYLKVQSKDIWVINKNELIN